MFQRLCKFREIHNFKQCPSLFPGSLGIIPGFHSYCLVTMVTDVDNCVTSSGALTLLLFCSNIMDHGKADFGKKAEIKRGSISAWRFRDAESSTFVTNFD